jgi:glyoxylase-like metal-dependent hydrolase (beta-lactamase superfamily II)
MTTVTARTPVHLMPLTIPESCRYGPPVFPGGPGGTFGDAAAFTRIMDSLETRLFEPLGDDVWVYPGHGDDTTLGAERPHLGEWRDRGW